jgi:hypothetical protein
MFEIPRRKLLGMTMAVFGFFTTLSRLSYRDLYQKSQDLSRENMRKTASAQHHFRSDHLEGRLEQAVVKADPLHLSQASLA